MSLDGCCEQKRKVGPLSRLRHQAFAHGVVLEEGLQRFGDVGQVSTHLSETTVCVLHIVCLILHGVAGAARRQS